MNFQTLQYLIIRAGNGIFAIVTIAAFTRFLNVEEYGIYTIGMSLVTVISGAFYNWLNAFYSRFIFENKNNPNKLIISIILGFGISTLLVSGIYVGIYIFSTFYDFNGLFIVIMLITTLLLGIYSFALQVKNSSGSTLGYLQLSWIKAGVSIFIGLALVLYDWGSKGAMIGFLIGILFTLFTILPIKLPQFSIVNIDFRYFRFMLIYGLPLSLNYIIIAIVDVADRLIIANILGVSKVASYAAAYDLTQQTVGPILNILYLTAFPLIIKNIKSNMIYQNYLLKDLGSKILIIGMPFSFGIAVLSDDIANIIFDINYRSEASIIMPWIAVGIFCSCLKNYYYDIVFQIKNKTNFLLIISIIMIFLNIFLNIYFLPRFGIIAAAWISFFTFFIGAVASCILGLKFFLLPNLRREWIISIISSATMVFIIFTLPKDLNCIYLIIKAMIAIIVYLSTLNIIKRLIK